MGAVYISTRIQIPESELTYSYARSSGPGGQHVNKTSTKITLSWSLEDSASLSPEAKQALVLRLGGKLTNDGRVIITSDRFRSQERNKSDCLEKFTSLLKECTSIQKRRKKTRPTRSSKEKRLKNKKSRSETKQMRKKVE